MVEWKGGNDPFHKLPPGESRKNRSVVRLGESEHRIRNPAVAGFFYPEDREALIAQLERLVETMPGTPRRKARAIVVPHAGYVYSGRLAAATYASVDLPASYFLLCHNHTGRGAPMAISSDGTWLTPLGSVEIDRDLARRLCERCPKVEKRGSPLG